MITTRLRPFHCRHPFVVVAVKCQIKVRAGTVRLSTNRKLSENTSNCFSSAAISCTSDCLLEPFMRLASVNVRWGRTCKSSNAAIWRVRRGSRIAKQVTETLVEREEVIGCTVVGGKNPSIDHVVDDEKRRLGVRIRYPKWTNFFACITWKQLRNNVLLILQREQWSKSLWSLLPTKQLSVRLAQHECEDVCGLKFRFPVQTFPTKTSIHRGTTLSCGYSPSKHLQVGLEIIYEHCPDRGTISNLTLHSLIKRTGGTTHETMTSNVKPRSHRPTRLNSTKLFCWVES